MNVTTENLNQICKVLNDRLGLDGSAKDAFYIDKDADGYHLERVDGRSYGPRADRKTVYNYISGMIDAINLDEEGVG